MRDKAYDDLTFLVIALEELCHCFYGLKDGEGVEEKVEEVLRFIYPGIQLPDSYKKHDIKKES